MTEFSAFRYGFLEFQRRNWRIMVAFALGGLSLSVSDTFWGIVLGVLATAGLCDWRLHD
jgi:predicted benzoate:H+ symporter BenE